MKFVLVQTAVGDYRREFLKIIQARMGRDFLLLTGPRYFDGTTLTRVDLGENQQMIQTFSSLAENCRFKQVISAVRCVLSAPCWS